MFRDITASAIYMGLLAAFVGYSASFAIVLAGLLSVGATPAQAATGLFFAGVGMGVCSIWLPMVTRIPAAVAWSTPGAAFLASAAVLPGGFAEAVGAILCCAVLIVATGFIPALGRVVAAIPKPVANALLAGVIFKLCLAPALALGSAPLLILPVIVAWVLGMMWHRLAAMPFAVIVFVIVLIVSTDFAAAPPILTGGALPDLQPVLPVFAWQSMISIAIPLYLVTMAGQNVPGFAVLELNGFALSRQRLLRQTGLASLVIAPFGAVPVNMSAITAAMMSGEEAGRDPAKRYWAAIASGLGYLVFSLAAAPIAALAQIAPAVLITGVAGLALLPAFAAAVSGAFTEKAQIEAPALTFVIAASSVTIWGIGGAFWGLLAGVVIWWLKGLRG